MSWWSDLASKAEDLLNRVDQTAAVALHNKDGTEPGAPGMQRHFPPDSGWRPAQPPEEKPTESAWYGGPSQKSRKPPPQKARSVTPPTRLKKKDDEAALLDFLNAPDVKKDRPRSAVAKSQLSQSRKSSTSSTKSESVVDFSGFDDYGRVDQGEQSPVFVTSQNESESLYAALKNNFSKSDIRRSSSVVNTVEEKKPGQSSESGASSPVVVHTDDISSNNGDSPVILTGSDSPMFMLGDDTPDDDQQTETTGFPADPAPDLTPYTDEVVEVSAVPVESPPVEEDNVQTSVLLPSVGSPYEAPPEIMTSSFQNPYADPEPSVPDPNPEPEPEPEPSPDLHNVEQEALRQKISSLELENKLLRSEVAALNNEIVTLVQREKNTQQELAELTLQSEQMLQIHARLREYESRDCDLRENLKAKDHQIGVLRVRLEELDNEMAGKNQAISLLENDRERILRDHSDTSGVQNQALENLRSKLLETENSLRREQDSYRQMQREHVERQTRLEDDQTNLAEQLQVLHKKLLDEKNRSVELTNQMRGEKQSADAARQELTEYKEKAARILQSKDKLIASLRDGGATSPDVTSSASVTSELEEVKQERDMYREELQVMSINQDRLKQEMAELESQIQTDHDEMGETINNLEEQLEAEKRKREDCDQEILKLKQELRYAHEEILQQRVTFQNQLVQKDNEIERLSGQLSSKMTSNTSQAELENRLRALTESLIQKQTMLENISTEKTSLTLQLERMERRFRDSETLRNQAASAHINISDDSDSSRHRLPLFLNETTYDTHVTRGMKRAANSLDAFSIRLGVFLRRYPIARVFVILYMFMLHLWVSVVLLTYQPEIHGQDFSPLPPGHEH